MSPAELAVLRTDPALELAREAGRVPGHHRDPSRSMRLEDVKVGQQVRVVDALGSDAEKHVGRVGAVADITDDMKYPVNVSLAVGETVAFAPGELEPVVPVIDWQARAERAEADADQLAHHLRQLCDEMHAERYEPNRPCRGCYQVVYDHDEAVAQR